MASITRLDQLRQQLAPTSSEPSQPTTTATVKAPSLTPDQLQILTESSRYYLTHQLRRQPSDSPRLAMRKKYLRSQLQQALTLIHQARKQPQQQ